jgi:hypothetical protein
MRFFYTLAIFPPSKIMISDFSWGKRKMAQIRQISKGKINK